MVMKVWTEYLLFNVYVASSVDPTKELNWTLVTKPTFQILLSLQPDVVDF